MKMGDYGVRYGGSLMYVRSQCGICVVIHEQGRLHIGYLGAGASRSLIDLDSVEMELVYTN